ncbi:MAG TPA: orotidine-5'-phosphate decarboxylase [Clostridiales bacterium]|nr:orotidine-5'-phosphate decarboxylase [Clostridiales bacterium]HPV01508.1 orotidine-5'-phosphate decarboxylase [Clostridiales bacterium]
MFVDRLTESIKKCGNPSVAGLDPKLGYIPSGIKEKAFREYGTGFAGAAEAILEFNKRLIDALCDVVPAVKPQLAYYEMYGAEGIRAFAETCRYARARGMIVIADGKRNDIGSTAQAYSAAYLGKTDIEGTVFSAFDTDALTVNPYLGIDGVKPFIDECAASGRGIFVLVKTSNRSSGQIQDLVTQDGRHVYEKVAELVDEWSDAAVGRSGYSSIGAVVGATYPEQARVLRKIMKKSYFLVPGYGAQGGTAQDAACAFNDDGLGAIVNASRSIMCAWQSEAWSGKYGEGGFDQAARDEAIRMREDLRQALEARK